MTDIIANDKYYVMLCSYSETENELLEGELIKYTKTHVLSGERLINFLDNMPDLIALVDKKDAETYVEIWNKLEEIVAYARNITAKDAAAPKEFIQKIQHQIELARAC